MIYFSNCLWYALDMWVKYGSGILFVKSDHWFIPHAQCRHRNGDVTHFVPLAFLPVTALSIFGFYGCVKRVSADERREPMTKMGMLIGYVIAGVSGGVWAMKRTIESLFRSIP